MQRINPNPKIQVLRGIAIIAVVLIHTCPLGYWQVFFRPFINFAVAVFLFLSGYLTKTENEDWIRFYKKRISRVLIPYFIWTLLYSISFKAYDLIEVVRNLLTGRAASIMYYIFVYIQFVLLTPVLGKLAKSKYQWLGWLISPLSVLLLKYYPMVSGEEFSSYISLIYSDSCLGWFTFYYLGLLLGNNILLPKYKMPTLFVAYTLSLIINMVESYIWLLDGNINCGTQVKLSSFLSSTIFILIAYNYIRNDKYIWTNNKLFVIGNYSFGIYLTHIMFIRIYSFFPIYKELPFVINSTIVLFSSLLLVYCGSKICGRIFCKALGFM